MVRIINSFWKHFPILVVYTVFCFISAPAVAQVGTAIASGQTVTVDAHGACRQVTNPSAATRMVFTGTSAEWQSFRDNPSGLGMGACVEECSINYAMVAPVLVPRQSWTSVAISADGMKLAATGNEQQVYTSTDGGLTWVERASGQRWWSGIASSSDGKKLVAVASRVESGSVGAFIYTSTDSGITWVERGSKQAWFDVASSADGQKLVAVVWGGKIYTSTDSGVTWQPRESDRAWRKVASSADGNKLVALASGGHIYTSADAGVTWVARESARQWYGVTSSADGNKLAAIIVGGQIYTSADSGVTWQVRESNRSWQAITSSTDGSQIIATAGSGTVYVSRDSGQTWQDYRVGTGNTFTVAALSASGNKFIGFPMGDRFYILECSSN